MNVISYSDSDYYSGITPITVMVRAAASQITNNSTARFPSQRACNTRVCMSRQLYSSYVFMVTVAVKYQFACMSARLFPKHFHFIKHPPQFPFTPPPSTSPPHPPHAHKHSPTSPCKICLKCYIHINCISRLILTDTSSSPPHLRTRMTGRVQI